MTDVRSIARQWRLAAATCAVFLLSALAAEVVVHQTSGLTAIWPCNAIILALLLVRGRERDTRLAIAAGAFAGSLLSGALRSQPALLSLIFPIANTGESLLAAWIIGRIGRIDGPFDRIGNVVSLGIASVLAPAIPAVIGALALHLTLGMPLLASWLNWYGAAALGLAVVTPGAVVALHVPRGAPGTAGSRWKIVDALVGFGMVAAVSILVFDYFTLPLLSAILPFIMLVTFRMRQLGSVGAVLIVALVAAQATAHGVGPFARTPVDPAQQFLILQGFLAATFLTALPISAALAERDARANEARLLAEQYRAVVENIGEVIFRVDPNGTITYLNPAWEAVSGHPVHPSLGSAWADHVEPDDRAEFHAWAQPVFGGQATERRRLVRFLTSGNGTRWMEVSLQTLRNAYGEGIGATGTLRDVDDRKRLEEHVLSAKRRAEERAREASLLAATDELTGLANRRAFGRHLDRQIDNAYEFGWKMALAIFDVDHFKRVNDVHGHAVGDRVLQRVAARALGSVRSGDLIGRLGGEEFGILMPGASREDARAAAERLRLAIQAEIHDGEEALPRVTVSVGIASYRVGQTASELLREADTALYAAKSDGRNRTTIAA